VAHKSHVVEASQMIGKILVADLATRNEKSTRTAPWMAHVPIDVDIIASLVRAVSSHKGLAKFEHWELGKYNSGVTTRQERYGR
jgi:hypothetical protein